MLSPNQYGNGRYLLGRPFIIFTDHKSLKCLMTLVIYKPEQQHYLSRLGKHNVVVDALSRRDSNDSSVGPENNDEPQTWSFSVNCSNESHIGLNKN